MGGTFMSLPEEYRDYFIRNLHDALSGHTSNNVAEAVRYFRAPREVLFILCRCGLNLQHLLFVLCGICSLNHMIPVFS